MRKEWFAALAALLVPLAGCTWGGGDGDAEETPSEWSPAELRFVQGEVWLYDVVDGEDAWTSRVEFVEPFESEGVEMLRFRTQEVRPGQPGNPGRVDDVERETLAVKSSRQLYPRLSVRYDPPLNVLVPQADHEYVGVTTLEADAAATQEDLRLRVEYLGVEDVTVAAGTFRAFHYRTNSTSEHGGPQVTDVWFSPDARNVVLTVSGDRREELREHVVP